MPLPNPSTSQPSNLPTLQPSNLPPILVSACLLGIPCAYDGRSHPVPFLQTLAAWGRVVPICPEVCGGLPVPRPPAEIQRGSGADVLAGRAGVVNVEGQDVTEAFLVGAQVARQLALRLGCRIAILREGSPSCGVHRIYDGTFQGRQKPGEGVTAALLRRAGLTLLSDQEDLSFLQAFR